MRHRTLLLAGVALALAPPVKAEDWNQWRGSLRNGTVASTDFMWPGSLAEDRLTKVWEIDLDESYASPVTEDGMIFSVATSNKKSEIVQAFDLKSGEAKWESDWEGAMKVPFFAAKNGSWVRATPAVSDGALYVAGMRDVLVKLDAETGEEKWRIDFTEQEGTELPAFGYCSSPLVDGGALYVQAGCAVAKLDAESGKTLWRALEDRRAMFGSAFSSPILATIGGKRQVIAQTRSTLGGMDPDTGEVLWSVPVEAFRGMNILTPTVIDENRIFTATYGGGSFLFTVERDAEGVFTVTETWRKKEIEGYMASPIVIGDHLYLLGRDKNFYCVEIGTGKVAWSSEEKFGEYWSLIHQDNRILALDQKGELLLINASPEALQILDRRKISPKDPTWAHVGIQGDLLMVRSLKGLAVYQWK